MDVIVIAVDVMS